MKKKGDIIGQRFNKLIVLKELPRGDDVNGWEDGMGNTITIE